MSARKTWNVGSAHGRQVALLLVSCALLLSLVVLATARLAGWR